MAIFGESGIGTGSLVIEALKRKYGTWFVLPEAGSLATAHAYCGSYLINASGVMSVYEFSPGSDLIGSTGIVGFGAEGWHDFNFGNTVNLEAGSYVLALTTTQNLIVYYYPDTARSDGETDIFFPPTLDDSWEGGSPAFTLDARFSFYANTSGAEPGSTYYPLETYGEGGYVIPSGLTYQSGTIAVSGVPNAGSRFLNWEGDLAGSENPTTFNVTGSSVISGLFESIPNEGYGDVVSFKLVESGIRSTLINHWKMNDNAASTTVEDSVGNIDLTVTDNTEDLHVHGKLNGALSFNGASQKISSTGFSDLDNLSYVFWYKQDASPAGERFFRIANTYGYITSTGKVYMKYFDGTSYQTSSTTTNGSNGSWHHCAICVSKNLSKTDVKIYIDGSLDVNETLNNNKNLTGTTVQIAYSDGVSYFKGEIDDFRIYNKKLVQSEVDGLYNLGYGTETENSEIAQSKVQGDPFSAEIIVQNSGSLDSVFTRIKNNDTSEVLGSTLTSISGTAQVADLYRDLDMINSDYVLLAEGGHLE